MPQRTEKTEPDAPPNCAVLPLSKEPAMPAFSVRAWRACVNQRISA